MNSTVKDFIMIPIFSSVTVFLLIPNATILKQIIQKVIYNAFGFRLSQI